MAGDLVVGLSSWIIQDGNYGDFGQGATSVFAIEFWAPSPLTEFEPAPSLAPSLTHRGNASHEAAGKVTYVADDWWVIDVGILAFRDGTPPTNVRPGAWLRGDIFVGVDPFFYFEGFGHRPGAPALIYDWRIAKIDVQTAPLVEISPRMLARDSAKLGWKEIVETKAWEDEGEYLLHCIRLDGPRWPTSKRHP